MLSFGTAAGASNGKAFDQSSSLDEHVNACAFMLQPHSADGGRPIEVQQFCAVLVPGVSKPNRERALLGVRQGAGGREESARAPRRGREGGESARAKRDCVEGTRCESKGICSYYFTVKGI